MSLSKWLNKRHIWLQVAAEKLMSKSQLDEQDISELAELCIKEAGVSSDITKPSIIDKIIIPVQTHSLRLCSIGEIQGINALAPRKPLDFGNGNLTVVYGDTASGKSGYVRILKHACGARVIGTLHGNVYSSEQEPQKCKISYKQNNSEVIPYGWEASDGCVPELQNVDIYDSHCGKVYVEGTPEVDYEPPELLIFSRLINVCDKISIIIDGKIQEISSAKNPILPGQYTNTLYGKWYSKISSKTTNKEIEEKTRWSNDDKKREAELQKRLKEEDPEKQAKLIRHQKTNLDQLISDTKSCLDKLSEVSCIKVFELKKDAEEKKIAAKASADEVFSNSPLQGIGSETWKLLWEKAREYSEKQAYENKPFPFTDENALCVLCQQVLSEEARKRMISFEEYVKGEMQKAAELAKDTLENAIDDIGEIQSTDNIKTKLTASGIIEENDISSVVKLFEIFCERKIQLQEVESIDKLTPLADTTELLKRLGEVSTQYEESAKNFESDAQNDNRPEIEKYLLELQAHNWVSEQKEQIIAETERFKRLDILNKAKKLANTGSISKEKSIRSEHLITEAFIERFNNELKTLGASKIKVKLVKAIAIKGQISHRIQIKKNNDEPKGKNVSSANTNEILSEGEQRIVSLAVFLADVTGKPNKASFVFDDPISSLDHTFEEAVSKRLVELSIDRQVIVFTHRLSLLGLIEDYGKKEELRPHVICVRQESWGTGEPGDTSLGGKTTTKALKTLLGEELSRIRKIYYDDGGKTYEYAAKGLCSEVRILLERIIENDLLADVVKRHRRAINTKGKIEKLACITNEDCRFLDAMMTEYSRYEHFQSDEAPVSLPDPDKLKEDMQKLKDWHDGFIERREGETGSVPEKDPQTREEALKPLIVRLVGRAAAQSDGRCIDLEGSHTVSIELIAERGVLVTGDTLDPVARPGQYVLLSPESKEFDDGDLVAVEYENQKLLRRVWQQDNKHILLEAINPLKTTSSRIIDRETINLYKVVGVLFEPRGNEYAFGSYEWDSDSIYNLRNIDKMNAIMVEGNSIDPVARDGQYVLIKEVIPLDRAKDGMLAVIETAENGRVIKRINRIDVDGSIILTSINLIDPHKPIIIDIAKITNIYPLVGVLFEVATVEN